MDVNESSDEPILVPLAIPLLAGPSALASVLFLMSSDPGRWPDWLATVLIAWAMTATVLLLSSRSSHQKTWIDCDREIDGHGSYRNCH